MNLGFFVLVHQQEAKVLERFGKFARLLEPGFNFKVPMIDEVAYHHSLKEQVIDISGQTAITKDNVSIRIDGVLYFKIQDPYKASYAINNPVNALSLLAQTSMRSEIGKIMLDRTFEERDTLNVNIKAALNHASNKWGIDCMRYEIKDIKPPEQIKRSMELQAESERIKRSKILNSEGEMRSKINIAEGIKRESILNGEGQAAAILQEAKSLCESLTSISDAIRRNEGRGGKALQLRLSEQYLETVADIYAKSNVLMTPTDETNNNNLTSPKNVAQILSMYKSIIGEKKSTSLSKESNNGNDAALRRIAQDLDELKHERAGASGQRESAQYRYLDEKTLYSSDA